MNPRPLGRTGLLVSPIGLGTWAFGGSDVYGSLTEAESIAVIRNAHRQGVTVFDTAPLYGTPEQDGVAEIRLGRALRGVRDSVVIATKFGRSPQRGVFPPAFHAARLRESVEESLQRLGTDRLDVVFFHSPFSPDEIHEDVWEAFATLRQAGKVRFVGHSVSNLPRTAALCRRWAQEGRIEVAQIVLSLLNREGAPLMADLARLGVGVVAREVLANGWLAGRFTADTVFPPGSLNSRWSAAERTERAAAVEGYRHLVRGDLTCLAQAAYRWVLDQPGVSLALAGARSEAELTDAIHASRAAPLAIDELAGAARPLHRDFDPA